MCGGRCQELLSCARSLVTDFPQGVRECREPELGLEELLRHRCQLLQQHEEYQVGRPPPPGLFSPLFMSMHVSPITCAANTPATAHVPHTVPGSRRDSGVS